MQRFQVRCFKKAHFWLKINRIYSFFLASSNFTNCVLHHQCNWSVWMTSDQTSMSHMTWKYENLTFDQVVSYSWALETKDKPEFSSSSIFPICLIVYRYSGRRNQQWSEVATSRNMLIWLNNCLLQRYMSKKS